MRIGKVPEAVLKRSVLKQIGHRREELVTGAGVGGDFAAVKALEGEVLVLSGNPAMLGDIGYYSVLNAVNDIAASGSEPIGVLLCILLPDGTGEADLKQIVRRAEETCKELNIQIMGGHTEVSRAVNRPVITATGIGRVRSGELVSPGGARPGDDVVITKWIGLEGSAVIAAEKERELTEHFNPSFVRDAMSFSGLVSVKGDSEAIRGFEIHSMHNASQGGIFGALWELAASAKAGLCIELKEIPVRQETIEIAEFYGINPYELNSGGAMLITAPCGHDVVKALKAAGINAAVAGRITEGRDRVVKNGDDIRFLEPPVSDELYKIL
ncbi:MAG TPA: hydrogenase maturation factor [Lachnospiraceae bacterium]|nr:hydrogenase maturation factor [Lachnospiraceae bacterium]